MPFDRNGSVVATYVIIVIDNSPKPIIPEQVYAVVVQVIEENVINSGTIVQELGDVTVLFLPMPPVVEARTSPNTPQPSTGRTTGLNYHRLY